MAFHVRTRNRLQEVLSITECNLAIYRLKLISECEWIKKKLAVAIYCISVSAGQQRVLGCHHTSIHVRRITDIYWVRQNFELESLCIFDSCSKLNMHSLSSSIQKIGSCWDTFFMHPNNVARHHTTGDSGGMLPETPTVRACCTWTSFEADITASVIYKVQKENSTKLRKIT